MYDNGCLPEQYIVERFLEQNTLNFYKCELLKINSFNFQEFQCEIRIKSTEQVGNFCFRFDKFNNWCNGNT